MTTSCKLIMAARTSWHSSESASGEKRSKEKNGASRFLSLPISEPPPYSGWYATKKPRIAFSVPRLCLVVLVVCVFLSVCDFDVLFFGF